MAVPSLVDLLWKAMGWGKKPRPAFESEQEAYEFCQKAYKDSGGVTPELQRAYEFYLQNVNEDCRPGIRP